MILKDEHVASSPLLLGLEASVLEAQCDALEQKIRTHTNNMFRVRESRVFCDIIGSNLIKDPDHWYEVGDRIEIVDTWNRGLYNVTDITGDVVTLDKALKPSETKVLVYKIEYPADVIAGIVKLLEHDNDPNVQARVGVTQETLSRHSITYESISGENEVIGYPVRMTSFLYQYMRARF